MNENQKSFVVKHSDIDHKWLLLDAKDKILGRFASDIAFRLRGKHKPEYTSHMDNGDYVVVVNVEHLRVTGKKLTDKKYYRHSGYPGGIYETTFSQMQEKFPGRALHIAVKGMLPKGPIGYEMIKKLKIYEGENHPHQAQQPESVKF